LNNKIGKSNQNKKLKNKVGHEIAKTWLKLTQTKNNALINLQRNVLQLNFAKKIAIPY